MVRPRGGLLKVGILIAVAMVVYPPWEALWKSRVGSSTATIYGPIWWLALDPESSAWTLDPINNRVPDLRHLSPGEAWVPVREIQRYRTIDDPKGTAIEVVFGVYGVNFGRLLSQLFYLALMMQIIALSTKRGGTPESQLHSPSPPGTKTKGGDYPSRRKKPSFKFKPKA